MKVLILGLDGGSWNVLEPLARAGAVPNLARIMEGVWGPLESTIPPVTPPAWTSFMTGKNPGKHGLFHFMEPVPGSYAMRYANARSRKASTIWSLLSERDRRVGVINVPMTFPPEPVNGFMISGMDAPDETSDLVHPRGLAAELRKAVGPVRLDAQHLGFMRTDRRRQQTLELLRVTDQQRLRTTLWLLDRIPVEVLMVVYGSPDAVQHHFWHYADRAHYRYNPQGAQRFGTAIADVYRRLDSHLGALMERLDPDGVTMVVSDHGFGPTSSRILYLNRYLAELGLLGYREEGRGGAGRLGAWVMAGADRIMRGSLSSGQKRRLARLFPGLRVRWEASLSAFDAIDWGATKAYSNEALSSSATIWINLRGRQPAGTVSPGAEYRELLELIEERLLVLKDPMTGAPLVRRIFRRDEIYEGPQVDQAPDLFLSWWEEEGFETRTSRPEDRRKAVVAEASATTADRAEWSGSHRLDGILAIRGAGIRRVARLPRARIIDLAPTILYILGEAVPDDMDGRVLAEIFEPDRLARHPVVSCTSRSSGPREDAPTYSAEESEVIEGRLRDLGYLE